MAPAAVWYFLRVPEQPREFVFGGAAIVMTMFFLFGTVASFIVGVFALRGLLKRHTVISLEMAAVLAAVAFIATGSMEYVREGIRKPFVIYNYMYANGIALEAVPGLNRDGILPSATMVCRKVEDIEDLSPNQQGKLVFTDECVSCHTGDGTNGVAPLIRNWRRDMIDQKLAYLHRYVPYIPPFIGTEDERQALAEYLPSVSGQTPH